MGLRLWVFASFEDPVDDLAFGCIVFYQPSGLLRRGQVCEPFGEARVQSVLVLLAHPHVLVLRVHIVHRVVDADAAVFACGKFCGFLLGQIDGVTDLTLSALPQVLDAALDLLTGVAVTGVVHQIDDLACLALHGVHATVQAAMA